MALSRGQKAREVLSPEQPSWVLSLKPSTSSACFPVTRHWRHGHRSGFLTPPPPAHTGGCSRVKRKYGSKPEVKFLKEKGQVRLIFWKAGEHRQAFQKWRGRKREKDPRADKPQHLGLPDNGGLSAQCRARSRPLALLPSKPPPC